MTDTDVKAQWEAQEKARRSKFTWAGRRLEDGKVVFWNVYQIGSVLLAAAVVLIPWFIGVREILKKVF